MKTSKAIEIKLKESNHKYVGCSKCKTAIGILEDTCHKCKLQIELDSDRIATRLWFINAWS